MVTNNQLTAIRKQIALHTEFITELNRVGDFSYIRLFNTKTGELSFPPNIMRRGNDLLAAAYVHALAIDQQNGDDCIDANGKTIELKLAYIKSEGMTISSQGNVIRKTDLTTIESNTNAKFRRYKGTQAGHHEKDTAFVLMSYDHNCFITAFMMPGKTVEQLIDNGQSSVERSISLSQFIKHGYEIGSSVPHIGWDRYKTALKNFVAGCEGKCSVPEAGLAHAEWAKLADLNNLQRL